ncbi:hypothetical protein JXE69_000563 [Salmonella enterica subsp. houtenae serovar 17:z29:-]|nr:hypothetical protein [Salmonella enterica subsp. houtenae serovar 17:z29:-]
MIQRTNTDFRQQRFFARIGKPGVTLAGRVAVMMRVIFEFPAPAGINRERMSALMLRDRVPRASGDKPASHAITTPKAGSSPRQRG